MEETTWKVGFVTAFSGDLIDPDAPVGVPILVL